LPRGSALAVAGVIGSIIAFYVDHKEPHEKSVTNIYILDENAAKTLTAQLILDRQTPPGIAGAVDGAVRSITRGAAAGDSRLQQALALLKDNKVGEATQLLSSIAEEKTARAGQAVARAEQANAQAKNDRNEAAIVYRNFGAIAALRDPKKSLEAYARAVELNRTIRSPSIGTAGLAYWLAISRLPKRVWPNC
jgi:hypothetical protein